jgi:hypothetical protein
MMSALRVENQRSIPYMQAEGEIPLTLPEGTFLSLTRKPPLKIYTLGFQPAKSIPEIPFWFLRQHGS